MGTGGGPHGQSLGILKCTNKTPLGEQVSVSFSSADGSASFLMNAEQSEYFTVGQSYHLSATQP